MKTAPCYLLAVTTLCLVMACSTSAQVSWQEQPAPITANFSLLSVQFVNTTTGWAVGSQGTTGSIRNFVIFSGDGGAQWSERTSGIRTDVGTRRIIALEFLDASTGYVCGGYGALYKTINGGQSWTKLYTGADTSNTTSELYDVDFGTATVGWVGGTQGGKSFLTKTSDGGATWTQQSGTGLITTVRKVCAIDDQNAWAMSQQLHRTTNAGLTWTKITFNDSIAPYSISALDAQRAWLMGSYFAQYSKYGVYLFYTANGGTSWTQLQFPTSLPQLGMYWTASDIHFYDQNTGWICGGYEIFCTTNAGQTWVMEYRGVGNFQGICFVERDNGWVVGTHSSLGGSTGILHRVGGTPVEQEGIAVPDRFLLEQNYPNPFNPTTVIRYQLPVASDVKLVAYDLMGREVAQLVNERKSPGCYAVQFDAANLASGMYFYRLMAGYLVQNMKMIVIR